MLRAFLITFHTSYEVQKQENDQRGE